MKKKINKILLPISLIMVASSGLAANFSNIARTNTSSYLNSATSTSDTLFNPSDDIHLSGMLKDNFIVNYDNGSSITNLSIGLSSNYWNLNFTEDKIPRFANYKNQYVSDIPSFSTTITDAPIAGITSNAINLKLFKTTGDVVAQTLTAPEYKSNHEGKYGFKVSSNSISDPYQLNQFKVTNQNTLLKVQYQFGWVDPKNEERPSPGPFIVNHVDNGWYFNGYVGLNSKKILSTYNPEPSTWIDGADKYCFPKLTAGENEYDNNMTALSFVKQFETNFKGIISLNVSNNLPIDQITNLRLRAIPSEGKVLLVYDLKNGVQKENGWYSDVDTSKVIQDQTLEIASGFWIDTELANDTIDGSIITQGYIPSTVDGEIFKQWVFDNRNYIWNKIPSINKNDIIIDTSSKEVTPNDREISYRVCLKKKYVKGQEVILSSVTDADYIVIRIINFNKPSPTEVLVKDGYQSLTIRYKGEMLPWETITPTRLKEILITRVADKKPSNGDTSLDEIISHLAIISGGLPLTNGEYAKIKTINASQITTLSNKDGTIVIPFMMDYAYELVSGKMMKIENKVFNLNFEGLKKLYKTDNLSPMSIEGYNDYLVSTITTNPSSTKTIQLYTTLKAKILEQYLANNTLVDPSLVGGQVPEDFKLENIIKVELVSANDEIGSATFGYTLNKYYDEECNLVINNTKDFQLEVSGFYTPVATISDYVKEINVVGVEDVVAKPNLLNKQYLINKNIKIEQIFNFTKTKASNAVNVSTFGTNDYSWSMNDIVLDNVMSLPNEGAYTANVTISKGFTNDLKYVTTQDFIQQVKFTGFKQSHATVMNANNSFVIASDSKYAKTLPQLIIQNQKTEFQNYIKAEIVKHIDDFVDYMPTQAQLGSTPLADIIDVQVSDKFSNKEKTIEATLTLKKVLNDYEEVILATGDAFTKTIQIRGFVAINLESTVCNQVEISITDNSIYANELTINIVEGYFSGIYTQNNTIPKIKVTEDESLSTPATITYKSMQKPQRDADGQIIVVTTATLTGMYETSPDGNDIIYVSDRATDFNIVFKGFKEVQQPVLKNRELIGNDKSEIAFSLSQYYFMNSTTLGSRISYSEATIEKLESVINTMDLRGIFGIDYQNLLPSNAKVKIKSINDYDNYEGTLDITFYFDKIYNEFHNVITQSAADETLVKYDISISGFRKITEPTLKGDVLNVLNNQAIFGEGNIYEDQVSDTMIINYINKNPSIFAEKDKSGFDISVDITNRILYDTTPIGKIIIDRENDLNQINVTFEVQNGIKLSYGKLIEVNSMYPTGYNEPFTSTWTIQCEFSGTTQIKEDNTALIKLDNYVDDYLNGGSWDNEQISRIIKSSGVDPTKLFYDTGRATNITWDNFDITVNTNLGGNAATGIINMNFEMSSGSYFENGKKIDATKQPKVFKTTISTIKKRPITGVPSEGEVIKLNKSDLESAFIGIDINGKYAYQVAEELINNNITTEITHFIKTNPSIFLKNLNSELTSDLPYTSDQVFATLDKSYFTVLGDNKNGKIIIKFGGFEVQGKYIYDSNGFPNGANLTIPHMSFEIKIQEGQDKLRTAKPLMIKPSYTLEGVSNLSINDYVDSFNDGDMKKFIYEEILWPEYQSFYDPYTFREDLIFSGLNENYNPINSLADFKQWIIVDISHAKNNGSSLDNITLIVKDRYFGDDMYYSWMSNAPKYFDFSINGFGSKLAAINWPVYVGVGVGVLGALSICLLVFAWVKHKNKKLRFE